MANTGKPNNPQRDKPENLGSSASHLASQGKQAVQDAASSVAGTAHDLTRRAGDMASTVGHQAEEAVSGLGGQMKHLAGTIRESVPHEGFVGTAATTVADTLDRSGRYLQEQDLSDMANDLGKVIRQYPIQSVLVGIGVGFLMARAIRS